jgi:hypothetical protein
MSHWSKHAALEDVTELISIDCPPAPAPVLSLSIELPLPLPLPCSF